MSNSTIAAPVAVLTADQTLTARDCGFQFARNQLANLENAQTFARMIGTEPTFEQWEESRISWIAGYVEANPDNTGNAADKAWARFSGLLKELFGLEKPASKSAAAVKKAAERAAKQEQLLAAYADQTVADLRSQIEHAYTVLSKNPTHKDSLKAIKELDKVIKVKQSAENKQHGEELSELRKQVREAVTKCTDLEALAAALDILNQAE